MSINWKSLKERNDECMKDIDKCFDNISKMLDDVIQTNQDQLNLIKEDTAEEET